LTTYEALGLVKQAREAGAEVYLIEPLSSLESEQFLIITRVHLNELAELRRLNRQLQARNVELEAFAHTVAHQLKNLSSLVTLYGHLLKEHLKLPEAIKLYVDGIIQNGHKMNNVINELQLLAGIRKDKISLKPLNMGKLVDQARQRLVYIIEERQAQIIEPEEWPVAWGYAPWVEEIWVNYIGNALKYGGEPPRVELGATVQADEFVRFWVRDNGLGLSPEKQGQIFKPFIHYNQITLEGHGLGLSIVQHIVKKLGGQVGVESQALPGQGSIFTFTLPQIQHHEKREAQ
jgi:signal transduction histidine kinase